MKKEVKITIILLVLLTISLIGNVILVGRLDSVKSDLCYSLKINNLFYSRMKNITQTKDMGVWDDFDYAFNKIKERNWMGCEE